MKNIRQRFESDKKFIFSLLFLIIIVASVLRLYQLGNIPISPDWDEVALGYDAYSIRETGKDEYGNFLPVVLRSFDDYKPALYAYLVIPSNEIFGLNVFSVRLPSAILGILTVLATFFLVKELFKRNDLALLTTFLLAISPWHIQFSRVAFESNVGLAFNVFTALFFLKGLKKPWFLFLSAIFAGLGLYVYQSEKVFTPLFVLLLVAIYRKELFKLPKKYLITTIIIGLLVVLPMTHYLLTDKGALLRAKGTSIFQSQTVILKDSVSRFNVDISENDYLGTILNNRRVEFAKVIVSGYLSHFNLNWLFITGDIARHHAPNMGLLYLWEFPFLFIGIYMLIFGEFDKKTKLLVFGWLLITPIPASITTGVPHAVRTLNFLPTWQIFIAIGMVTVLVKLWSEKMLFGRIGKYAILTFFVLFASFNFVYYLNQYFVQQNYFNAKEWQYGYAQAIGEVEKLKDKYAKIIVSDKEPLDKSYMFFLFYLKYPPLEFQKVGQYSSGGFAAHHNFDKYDFHPINWQEDFKLQNVLLVGTPDELGGGAGAIKTITAPDNTSVIMIVGK